MRVEKDHACRLPLPWGGQNTPEFTDATNTQVLPKGPLAPHHALR